MWQKDNKRNIDYTNLKCQCCGNIEYEFLEEQIGTYTQFNSKETIWEFNNKIVICNKCGHVYLNPTPTEKSLEDYYSSGMPLYEDSSSFSIDKRIEALTTAWKIVHPECGSLPPQGIYCEIGANDSSEYMDTLKKYFNKIVTIDINENCETDLDNVDKLNIEADVIASYFVMEHIGKVNDILKKCYRNLKPDGIMLIEVPNIEVYVNNPVALEALEHVNHFSPISLMNVCRYQGFKAIYFSREKSSRSCGFVAAFVKGNMNLEDAVILINKASIKEGVEKLKKIRPNNIKRMAEKFNANSAVLWCANDMCKEFLQEYESAFGKYEGLIIDENPKKMNYIKGKTVYTSSQAEEQLKKCKRVTIFSDCRKDVIFQRIKEIIQENISVEYVDDWFEVHKLQ